MDESTSESSALVTRICAVCTRSFGVCARCYRGAVTCGADCREKRRRAVRRAADRRYRLTLVGVLNRAQQSARHYRRRCKRARAAEIQGDPSPPIPPFVDDVPNVLPEVRADVVEAPDAACTPSPAPAVAPPPPRCVCCGRPSAYRITVTDHLANRERRRADWLVERRARRPSHAGRSP